MPKKEVRYRKAVFIVVFQRADEGIKYLVLKRKLHWKGWEFSKGGVEPGESEVKTVKREILEETGCKPQKIIRFKEQGKYKYDKYLPDRKPWTGQSYKLYGAEIKCNRVKIDKKEHSSYKWLDFKKAYDRLTWNDQKKCLKIVDNYLI